MYYFFIILSVFCVAAQFSLTKIYQLKAGSAAIKTLLFTCLAGAVSCLLFLCVNLFRLRVSGFSALMALLMSAACTLNGILGIVVVSYGKVSVFTMFMMLGGMLLPFVYGLVWLDEKISVCKFIGCFLLVMSLFAPLLERKTLNVRTRPLFYVLCFAVFLLNGAVSVISKAHQVNAAAVGTFDYLILVYLFSFAFSGLALLIAIFAARHKSARIIMDGATVVPKDKELPIIETAAAKEAYSSASGKRVIIVCVIAAYALISGAGYMLQLIGAAHLPASVLYPIVTGGTVVLTSLAGRLIFKEKLSPPIIAGMALTLASTILFVF